MRDLKTREGRSAPGVVQKIESAQGVKAGECPFRATIEWTDQVNGTLAIKNMRPHTPEQVPKLGTNLELLKGDKIVVLHGLYMCIFTTMLRMHVVIPR